MKTKNKQKGIPQDALVYCVSSHFGLATAAFAVAAGAAIATTVANFATAMTTTVAVLTGTTVATFAARATGGLLLHIAFGLGQESLAAELDLAVLLVEGNGADVLDPLEGGSDVVLVRR